MEKFARLLRENKQLGFFASVRLAVPLMLTLSVIVAIGTVLESMYDSDYAKIAIYQSPWFFALLILLWVNIFLSTLSRWPYRVHHTGFVITHIGLLTLLVGGLLTGSQGIDGQLRVTENGSSSTVILPQTVLGYQFNDSPNAQVVEIDRRLRARDTTADSSVNEPIRHLFWIKKYLPFATFERIVVAGTGQNAAKAGTGVSFRLKSAFFNVSEWLHSKENPVMQMGPATLILKEGQPGNVNGRTRPKRSTAAAVKTPEKKPGKARLAILDFKTRQRFGERSLVDLRNGQWTINGVTIRIKAEFKHAIVSANRITEGDGPEANPAFELEVSKGNETKREVLYTRFPGFSVNQAGLFGLQLVLEGEGNESKAAAEVQHTSQPEAEPEKEADPTGAMAVTPEQPTLPPGHPTLPPNHPETDNAPSMGSGGNVIEFWVDTADREDRAHIILKKGGSIVGEKLLVAGETFETPWMGIVITLASVVRNGEVQAIATPIEPVKGESLPPSALLIQLADGSGEFWLGEGSSQEVTLMNRAARIFFGRKTHELPFEIQLKRFTKTDYPGTETPMSFESLVTVPGSDQVQLISMNEPLKKDGFTVYQASYVLQPGQTPESIFSVNQDPGRPVKYIGALILAIGIITFTLMRSRWWKTRAQE